MHKPKLGIICVEQDKKTDKKLFNSLQEKFEIILFPIQKAIFLRDLKEGLTKFPTLLLLSNFITPFLHITF